VCPTIRNLDWTSSKTLWAISKERNANRWRFLLSFTQLSICESSFLGNGFTLMILFTSFNAFKHLELPYKICWKNAFWGSNWNKTLDSLTRSFSSIQKKRRNEPIVKLRSLGQSSLEYWAKALSPCPWIIIPINVTNNYPNPNTVLFFTWSWSRVVNGPSYHELHIRNIL